MGLGNAVKVTAFELNDGLDQTGKDPQDGLQFRADARSASNREVGEMPDHTSAHMTRSLVKGYRVAA
jgi:hypothetical protein